LYISAKEGVAIITFSPKPATLPSRASQVFFIFETALLSSTMSLLFRGFISIKAIV